ncbi:MAG: metallophosphoesterase [Methanocellales archaeon]|nr:metallophosphoesterase [Methanocellales archaeon]
MNEIIVVGDVHEGINFGFQIDPETGLSARTLDIHNNFTRAARFAIENDAKLFVIVGDLFNRTHVSPAFRELVRRDVIEPLKEADISIWILAGNHDQPRNTHKGTSIDDFRGYPHVGVYRNPAVEKLTIDGKSVGCIIVPYLHPTHIAGLVREKLDKETSQEQMFHQGQEVLKKWIKNRAEELDADFKILFAHYYIEGAKLRETACPEVLPSEFSFNRGMIPDNLDLAIFGHIHLHQAMRSNSTEIVYTGAVERIDWGEMDDKKGFIAINLFAPNKWHFEELPTRDMLKIGVEVGADDEPTQKILEAIPDVTEKLVRLEVTIGEGLRSRVAEDEIAEKLRDAFNYDVCWREKSAEKVGFTNFTMDPFELLKNFIEINYSTHPKCDALLNEGRNILEEVLRED